MQHLQRGQAHRLHCTSADETWPSGASERLGEGTLRARGEGGGGMAEQEERCIQSQRAELPQVMMMISIVPLQKQTELGSIYLEESRKVRIREIPGKRLIMKTSTLFSKDPSFAHSKPCAPHLSLLFCQSWSLALSLPSAIARAPLS